MNIDSIYEARAITRKFHAERNVAEWNQMFPHMQVKWIADDTPYDYDDRPYRLATYDHETFAPLYIRVIPLDGVPIDRDVFDTTCASEPWKQVSLVIGENEGAVMNGLQDLAICCRTSDLERWFTKPLALKKSKSPYAAKLRDLLPHVRHMASCLSLLR